MTTPACSDAPSRVLLGIEDDSDEFGCVRVACAEASSRGLPLHIVHAYGWPAMIYLSMHVPLLGSDDWRQARSRGQALVAAAVEKATESHPGLRVTGEAIAGRPRSVLMEQAATAALLVLGAGHSPRGEPHRFGSVGHYLAAYSPCPVMVAGRFPEQRPPGAASAVPDGLSSHGIRPSDSGAGKARLAH
jgi:nucleotide-binding universal stress UspA family protein